MKIICPTDLSAASLNAIEYAANFAQRQKGELTLYYVQPFYMSEGISYFAGGDHESETELNKAAEQLNDICKRTTASFKIPCTYEGKSAGSGGVIKSIADVSGDYDLMIIGTNGADNLSQFYLGSHSFRIAREETGPVLIVPETSRFRDILNVAFASDCRIGDTILLKQLKKFIDAFNPSMRVVHISEKDTALSREVYQSFCSLTEDALGYDQRITFERMISDNKADAIEEFMNKTQADLLTLYMEKHGLLYRLFHESVIKKLTSYASFPMLIFHK